MTDNRRSYGTGSLFISRGAWYGQWRIGGRIVKRKVGAKREPGSRDGLTRAQAEARLRRLMDEVRYAAPERRMAMSDLGASYLHHVEHVMQRKPSTAQDYRSILNAHLIPYFGARDVGRIKTDDFAAYMRAKSALAPKTVSNHLNFAHGLFAHACDYGWATSNPLATLKRPQQFGANPDIRFLEVVELEALLRAIPDDMLGAVELPLYLTAAMTGLRQGELIALRWRDVDWTAGLIRVRRSITRGKLGTPKSRRSSRAVPMADRVGAELERHFKRSAFQGDDDLVFCHPHTGGPYDPSKMRERFKDTRDRAGLRDDVRFHDLRHTFGTRMAAAGAPLRFIQEWMGHRTAQTTEIYADYAPDPTQGAKFAEAAFSSEVGARELEDGGPSRVAKLRNPRPAPAQADGLQRGQTPLP
jgi:integrase